MKIANDIIINESALEEATTSEILDISRAVNLSVQIVWASTTASFSITVEVSNDNSNWVTLGSAATVNNNNGNVVVEKSNNPYKYMRVSVARTSGTITTLVCTYNSQGF